MARKRPVDSGRTDSLNRPIKVSVPTPARAGSFAPDAGWDFPNHDDDHVDDLLDSILSGPTEEGSPRDYADLIQGHDEFIEECKERISQAESAEEVLSVVNELTSSDAYRDLPASIAALDKIHNSEKGKFYRRNAAMTAALESGTTFPEDQAEDIRKHGLAALEAYEARVGARQMMEDYKNTIATGMGRFHKEFDTPIMEYTRDTLGPLSSGGQYETGSREWLEFRQNGIGGSDIGAIADSESTYHSSMMARVWDSKKLPITDEMVQVQSVGQNEASDPISRGNVLEEFVVSMYRRDNPDDTVMVGKSSWVSPTSPMQLNYDAFLSSDGINPDGALEIKTSSRPQDWGAEEDGLDGVPANYRAQVLSQVYEAGFSRGAVSVLINETDMRTYSFDMTPALTDEAAGLIDKARAFKAKTDSETTNPYARPRNFSPRKGFTPEELNDGPQRDVYIRKVAALRGTSEESVRDEMQAGLDTGRPPAEVMRGLYENSDLSGRSLAGVDLETSALSPTSGRIIETGMLTMNMGDGSVSGVHSDLHGISPIAKRTYGTGNVGVHGISTEAVSDKPVFSNPATQRALMDQMISSRDLVAHNVAFERQWLRVHLDGFAKAEARGDIRFIDTRDVTMYATDAPGNSLEDFCEDNGVSYEGAHRAYQDTEMMMKALRNWSLRG